ncbi:TIR domain-containing protein [Vibrio alginolyticus]|uniref:SEFIR domain-containing protein n=1 Tax=Vibrio alginolyticus TaxID=663 RepID=UPI002FF2C070
MQTNEPKVFISYSWSSSHHQEMVKYWADRLIADGIEVIIDIYDLNEGDNKYAFMESMITDETVTHVLVVCDSEYAKKANTKVAGVGTESQIISSEVYKKVKQSKFIPILCEFREEDAEPIAPVFMDARIGINFSTPEAVNENWEQLIRLLYGKPLHVKPKKGKVPAYIMSDKPLPTSDVSAKYESFKQALLQDKKGLVLYRKDFIDSCLSYADGLRVRERPEVEVLGERVLEDCSKLKAVRNHLCDWILLEGNITPESAFSDSILEVLERLLELKSRPKEITSWNESWFEAHSVFVYETFLYIVAALIKTNSYKVLHEIFTSHYLIPETDRYGDQSFMSFEGFYGYSEALQDVLKPGHQLYAPAAELMTMQADREDLKFQDVMQAEALTLMMSCLKGCRWYPATLHYKSYGSKFPLFIRATQHKHFQKLAVVTGVSTGKALADSVMGNLSKMGLISSGRFFNTDFYEIMNLDKLDSIK